MKIHEYQAKQLLAARAIPVPLGRVAVTVDEAVAAVRPLMEESGNPVLVLKSQIHAGGRGKGTFLEHPEVSGVSVITEGIEGGPEAAEEKVRELAGKMLGSTLVTIQTGSEGKVVNRLYLEQGIDIDRELYLAVLLDRAISRNVVMASTEGGMDIEKVAAETPERILREEVDPVIGFADFQANELSYELGLSGDTSADFGLFVKALVATATDLDTDLIEINPLVVTTEGRVIALDGKMGFDDNALYRHPDVAAMRDTSEEDPAEIAARESGLSYIKLDGTIGCLVNGAGLAMATMDTIKQVGGEPANFLDVGGGADADQVATGFQIITSDPDVKGIFVNIFGGIMRCDVIATGIIEAVERVGLKVPLVVRLEGTNVELGRQILKDSGLDLVAADNLLDGAEKILELTR
ncbi:MAG TPA: ADP-forming succinate--CoA ligase subunit beta [Acidimicrobiia bacterium]|nr:ADP-forming succinate--CoA ligase subunit beta [Acidimicrobiia bacterium]